MFFLQFQYNHLELYASNILPYFICAITSFISIDVFLYLCSVNIYNITYEIF